MADAGIYIPITVCLIHCSGPLYSGSSLPEGYDATGPDHPSNLAPHENGIYMLACVSCTSVLLLCVCVYVVSFLATSLSSLYVRSVGVSPTLRLLARLGWAVLCEFVVCRWCSASTAWILARGERTSRR